MELRHLRTLDAIARHGSFTWAAEELHLAQSAVSQQVRRLEAELGVDLLLRSSRRVDVTDSCVETPSSAPGRSRRCRVRRRPGAYVRALRTAPEATRPDLARRLQDIERP